MIKKFILSLGFVKEALRNAAKHTPAPPFPNSTKVVADSDYYNKIIYELKEEIDQYMVLMKKITNLEYEYKVLLDRNKRLNDIIGDENNKLALIKHYEQSILRLSLKDAILTQGIKAKNKWLSNPEANDIYNRI